ncbi:hypothetical protein BDB01DRAFT_100095 [Pilobolus umbonatus]|nr:hypothetical protein BDB01DRAFT_100095 [Pilobolus umbonatus]
MPSLQSGTQSPFASWRDYQQQESEDYLTSRRDSNDNNEYEHRRSISGTWRAREFSRNVRERTGHVLDQEMVVEDDQREQSSSPHTTHHPPPEEENRAFDLLQQRATRAANEHPQEEVVREEDEIFDILENTDGILEAIGIHGNPIMLFQNFILMSIMINLCLGVTIWIPYVIGRFVILIFIPKLLGMLMYTLSVSTYPFVSIIRYYTYKLHPMNHASTMMPDSVWSLLEHIRQLSADFASSTIMKSLFDRISGLMDPLRLIINTMADMWTQFPVDQSNFNRILCIHLGYSVLISIGSWYLSKTKNVRAASTNEILRQQGVFLKVLTFILTEIVLFPLICGILLDISTLPLFKDCTFHDRLVFVSMNPFSGTFLHWFAGTGFIFNFSVFISLVREVVRPGVLWFIRDPKDLQFQPVQDIVNQPLLVLLKKLWTFAVIYFMLIMVGMGVVTLFVSKYASIYPIIWSFNIPISTLPIDLVAIHLLLSYTINYIVPREQAKQAVNTWWHIVSKQLRLTSFMFGGKYEEEEIRGHHSWKEWVFGTRSDKRSPITDEVDIFNITESIVYKKGGFARVPAYDNVPIFTNRRMIVPVNPITFQPLNRMEKATGHPATSQPGNESIDTIVVYLPPYFKLRIMIFLFLIWLTASILVCSVSIVPLLLGRHLLSKVIIPDKPVHDFYAFTAGAYAMIMMSSSLNWIVQKHKTLEDGHCIDIVSIRDYLAQVTYRIFMFLKMVTVSGILIPFLVGLILDLYIFTPLRLSKYKDAVVINLTEVRIMGEDMFYANLSS